MAKSEWVKMACDTDHRKAIIRGWFAPLCDDMTVESAGVLENVETGEPRKARAKMIDKDGKRFTAIRSRTKAGWSVELKAAM